MYIYSKLKILTCFSNVAIPAREHTSTTYILKVNVKVILQYSTVQYSTVQYSTELFRTEQDIFISHHILPSNACLCEFNFDLFCFVLQFFYLVSIRVEVGKGVCTGQNTQ